MDPPFSLKGKNALVTGSTRGIGLAIARGFLTAGATVTICGRKPEGVTEALAELSQFGDSAFGLAAHVGKDEDIQRLVDQSEERFGPVDILVNNAGTNPYFGPIVQSEQWAWDKTMEVNLKAPYQLSKILGGKMAERGSGAIINVASVAGLSAAPMQGIYSVTKAGLIMLTKVLAGELGPHGVRVNCICPGVIRTRLSEALWRDRETERKWAGMKALRRIGSPEEVAGAAIYLASDAASFTTGAVLPVDGGMII
jgi:NAD(P)-dependent dehydrogenase (short-subunit alcohol dehydrogenase family)